uniref:Uncharacterized protein n=1 Tax=Arundo donax TaxID=35708 RepID=A0A0A9C2F7_ARUDO
MDTSSYGFWMTKSSKHGLHIYMVVTKYLAHLRIGCHLRKREN